MLLCYITDRKFFPGSEAEQRHSLLQRIGEAAGAGIDYVIMYVTNVAYEPALVDLLDREVVRKFA